MCDCFFDNFLAGFHVSFLLCKKPGDVPFHNVTRALWPARRNQNNQRGRMPTKWARCKASDEPWAGTTPCGPWPGAWPRMRKVGDGRSTGKSDGEVKCELLRLDQHHVDHYNAEADNAPE